jgi:hypothetical protein
LHFIASHLHFALKATPFFFCARPFKKNYYFQRNFFSALVHRAVQLQPFCDGRGFQVRDPLHATDLSPETPEEQPRSNTFAPLD